MELKEWLDQYKSIKTKQPHLTTVIVYDKTVLEFLEELNKQIKNTFKMKNQFLSRLIKDKYMKLKKYIEDNTIIFKEDLRLSHVFLSGNLNTIPYYQLDKEHIKTLKEYQISTVIIKQNNYFELNYIDDLFHNYNFNHSIIIDTQHWKHIQLNKTKHKTLHLEKYQINSFITKITQYITKIHHLKKIENEILYCVVSPSKSLLKEISDKSILEITEVNKYPSLEDLLNLTNIKKIKQNQELLHNYMKNLNRPEIENKLIYGNFDEYIYPEIESYKIKELFYHSKHQELLDSIDNNYLNFKLIEIDTIINNDIGDQLLTNYGGFFGIRYY